MKVILAINSLHGGGAERVMAWLASRLSAAGHMVTLITFEGPDTDVYHYPENVERVHIGRNRYFNSSRLSAVVNLLRWGHGLRRSIRIAQADVVLSFVDGMNVYCLFSLLGVSIPIVVAERTDPSHSLMSQNKKKARPYLYRFRANSVVFQTDLIASKFKTLWRLDRVVTIPNAVQAEILKRFNDNPQNIVLAVGRLDFQKGQDVLLKAWSKIGGFKDGWTLRIVGDGIAREVYEAMISEMGISDSVVLAGATNDVALEYGRASIFVLPSRVEGFPNVLLEAMSAGKAVAVSNIPDACREVVTDGVDGILYDGESVDALVSALKLLISSPALRADLSSKAKRVNSRFSEDVVYSRWESCLFDACHKVRDGSA